MLDQILNNKKYLYGSIAAVVIVVSLLLYFYFSEKDPDEKALDEELKKIEGSLSFPDVQYFTLADTIEVATSGVADDEDAIYSVFRTLNNNADYLMLKKAFGERTYFGGAIFYNANLNYVLREVLSEAELQTINEILALKGITYLV